MTRVLKVEDPNIIPDPQITASSYYLSYYPHIELLNGEKGWCQKTSRITDDYLQVDVGARHTVRGVATQGKVNGSYVKKAAGSPILLMVLLGLHIKNKTSKRYEWRRPLFSKLYIYLYFIYILAIGFFFELHG